MSKYSIIYRVSYMSSGAGFLPSTEYLWQTRRPKVFPQEIGEIMRLCCRAMMDEFKGGRAVEIAFAGRYLYYFILRGSSQDGRQWLITMLFSLERPLCGSGCPFRNGGTPWLIYRGLHNLELRTSSTIDDFKSWWVVQPCSTWPFLAFPCVVPDAGNVAFTHSDEMTILMFPRDFGRYWDLMLRGS